MFYKDRTLLRMSLRKTLGFGPYVGCKRCVCVCLFFSFHSFSLLIFHLVRDKKEEDKIDSVECGRQRQRQAEREASTDSNSICLYRTEE